MGGMLVVALLSSAVSGAPPAALEVSQLCGAYRWDSGGFVDIQVWEELGPGQLVAFDDRGWVRALTPAGARAFTAGRSIAVPEPVAARVRFEPADGAVPARTLVWYVDGQPPRVARRVEDARVEDVTFANGATHLAGTLMTPLTAGPHAALVLAHGSGPQDRNGTLPFARFLVRHGLAILTFDKRGVGASQGDWRKASFEILAAVAFLRSRPNVDAKRIGLFGVSQGGWVGPLAASRSRDVALVVSVSGPGVTPGEQMLDMIEAELRGGRAARIAPGSERAPRRIPPSLRRSGRSGRRADLIVIPAANHVMLQASSGSMFEIPSLDRFVPEYRMILLDWLRGRFGIREQPPTPVSPGRERPTDNS